MLNQDTYAQISARLDDWLESQGGSVTNLTLDLLNRAQQSLSQYLPWEYLRKRTTLTVSNKTAALPADLDRINSVYHDSDGDGRPDFFYYNQSTFADNGYKITDSFTAASGHSLALSFYAAPTNTPYIDYQAAIANFAGTGTEYSFFPGDMLLLEAQYIHTVEMGLVGNEYTTIVTRREEQLRDYRQAHHNIDHDQRMVQNDWHGEPTQSSQYTMDGAIDGVETDDRSPSYDRGN